MTHLEYFKQLDKESARDNEIEDFLDELPKSFVQNRYFWKCSITQISVFCDRDSDNSINIEIEADELPGETVDICTEEEIDMYFGNFKFRDTDQASEFLSKLYKFRLDCIERIKAL